MGICCVLQTAQAQNDSTSWHVCSNECILAPDLPCVCDWQRMTLSMMRRTALPVDARMLKLAFSSSLITCRQWADPRYMSVESVAFVVLDTANGPELQVSPGLHR